MMAVGGKAAGAVGTACGVAVGAGNGAASSHGGQRAGSGSSVGGGGADAAADAAAGGTEDGRPPPPSPLDCRVCISLASPGILLAIPLMAGVAGAALGRAAADDGGTEADGDAPRTEAAGKDVSRRGISAGMC